MCNPGVEQHQSSNGVRGAHHAHAQVQPQHPHDYNYGQVKGSYGNHNAYTSSPVHAVSPTTWTPKPATQAPKVFVHDPYTLRRADDEEEDCYSDANVNTNINNSAESEGARVFCSGKGIPTATDEEFLDHIAPVSHLVTEIFRPRGGRKEFLYVEFSDPKAADLLLSWHPMKFRGSRLNLSRAKPASRVNQANNGNTTNSIPSCNISMARGGYPAAAAA